MGYKKLFKNKDGSYDMVDWSFDKDLAVYVMGNIIPIIFAFIFFSVVPLMTPFFAPISYHRDRISYAILSLVLSFIFLLDFHFGWLVHAFMSEDFEASYRVAASLHVAAIIISILILVAGEKRMNEVMANLSFNTYLIWLVTLILFYQLHKIIGISLVDFIGMAEVYAPFKKMK